MTPPKVTEMELQLAVHEVTMGLLEKIYYRTISEEANAWDDYISRLAGPT